MTGPFRLASGGLVDRARRLSFTFDSKNFAGYSGDSLASALLGSGVRLVGRSFKYHRPRGIVSAGPEEPCALVDRVGTRGREPNLPATMIELSEGLVAESQNRWPSLKLDLMAVNGLLSRFLGAGFYYKTFMWPASFWEKVYEPLIRRAAGLGRLDPEGGHPKPGEIIHDHCDVLVVGAGAAGLAAALALGKAGARVMLADQMQRPGGGTLLEPSWSAWREAMLAALDGLEDVRLLSRTSLVGAYGHGVFAAVERAADPSEADRLRIIRARRVVLATGTIERLIAFPGNDRPGVMLAGAARSYLAVHAVAVGSRPVLLAANDEAYQSVFALADAGIRAAAIIDPRPSAIAQDRALERGFQVLRGHAILATMGTQSGVRAVRAAPIAGGPSRTIDTDAVLMSGGYSPATALATQAGASLAWNDGISAFVPSMDARVGVVVGAAAGRVGLATAAWDGADAGRRIARDLGFATSGDMPDTPSDPPFSPSEALWRSPTTKKAFVDLQNDVTVDDIRLAVREGYAHVEHAKRYTTHGMGTDQGKIGGLVGSAVLAEARGITIAETGLPTPRPFVTPVQWAALAGPDVGQHMKPKRRLPLHDWHEQAGATFALTGLWLRPLVYSKESGWAPVLAEARAVRRSVGVTDVSSLGKIEVHGKDAAAFLDFIYANTISTLAIGRCRYGIMLREDGMMFDDGTVTRLGEAHYLITATTANTQAVLEHLEFHAQAVRADLNVHISDVTDHWATFALAGPRARSVLARLVDIDVADEALPFMAASPARIAGVPGRLFRISFSGELAFELAVPADAAEPVFRAILEAGAPEGIVPYGLDALNTLRIEKGHVTGAEMNGNTTMADLGFGRMAKKSGDFIGRTLRERPGLTDPDRQGLVGVRPIDRARRLRNGAHLVAPEAPTASLGFITSSTPSAELDGWVGLALLAGGSARIGERLLARSPVTDEDVPVEIVSPHFVDPDNQRVRSALSDPRTDRAETSAGAVQLSPVPIEEIVGAQGVVAFGRTERRAGSFLIGWRPGVTLAIGAVQWPAETVVIDRSSSLRGMMIAGAGARETLARLCRLDLHPRVFAVGMAASTIMAQIPVTISLLDEAPTFLILVPTTFSRHFAEALDEAAHSFGERVSITRDLPRLLAGDRP